MGHCAVVEIFSSSRCRYGTDDDEDQKAVSAVLDGGHQPNNSHN